MPISDATLIHRFSGFNRRYYMEWDNGEVAYFRASSLRDARKIARLFTARLLSDRVLVAVGRREEYIDDKS